MHKVDFSIITPVYNGEDFIKETVESVLLNTNNVSFEYIVINDGSTDRTSEILNEFESSIVIINQKNTGEANSVNKGLALASGKWGLVVSADDPIISAELFLRSKELLESNTNTVVVYPDWNMIDKSGLIIETKFVRDFSFERLFCEMDCLPGPGAIFALDKALKIGGRRNMYRFVSDYDFWLRMSQEGQFVHLPKTLAQWRMHDNSTSVSSKGYSMAYERILVIKNFLNEFPQPKNKARTALAHAYYSAATLGFYSEGMPSRRWMIKAIVLSRGYLSNGKYKIVLYILGRPITKYILKFMQYLRLLPSEIRK